MTVHISSGKLSRPRPRLPRWFVLSTVAIVLLLSVWFVGVPYIFSLRDIVIRGVPDDIASVMTSVLREKIEENGKWKNIFSLDTNAMRLFLEGQFDIVASVSVQRDFFHAVKINATIRRAVGVWCAKGSCVFFDRGGATWGSMAPSRGSLLVSVEDNRQDSSGAKDSVSRDAVLLLSDKFVELGIRGMTYKFTDIAPGDLFIETDRGYSIYFDYYTDLNDQIKTLNTFLASPDKLKSTPQEYIDLRTIGRVYFK